MRILSNRDPWHGPSHPAQPEVRKTETPPGKALYNEGTEGHQEMRATKKAYRPRPGGVIATCLSVALLASSTALAGPERPGQEFGAAQSLQRTIPERSTNPAQPDTNMQPLTPKQQRELLKANFEKMKKEADELSELAKSLQQDLDKSSANVLSLKVVERADKIEKLAKKIKNEAVQ